MRDASGDGVGRGRTGETITQTFEEGPIGIAERDDDFGKRHPSRARAAQQLGDEIGHRHEATRPTDGRGHDVVWRYRRRRRRRRGDVGIVAGDDVQGRGVHICARLRRPFRFRHQSGPFDVVAVLRLHRLLRRFVFGIVRCVRGLELESFLARDAQRASHVRVHLGACHKSDIGSLEVRIGLVPFIVVAHPVRARARIEVDDSTHATRVFVGEAKAKTSAYDSAEGVAVFIRRGFGGCFRSGSLAELSVALSLVLAPGFGGGPGLGGVRLDRGEGGFG